jgi:hypothetical protein
VTACGLAAVARGGSTIEPTPRGSASVQGVVNGQPFVVRNAIGLFSGDPPGVEAGVVIHPATIVPGTYSVLNYHSVRFQYMGSCLATLSMLELDRGHAAAPLP